MTDAQAQSTETEIFEKRLRAYAAGAGAVAAGLLAFSPPAAAEIVLTTNDVLIRYNSGPFVISIDGATEFTLGDYYLNHGSVGRSDSLYVTPASGAGVVGRGRSNQAAPLKFGAVIGPADDLNAAKQRLAFARTSIFGGSTGGPFINTANRFLGLKFELRGEVYYGWAGFKVVYVNGPFVTAVLTAYAYETTPDTPIYAGQSSDGPLESRLLPANGAAPNTAQLQPATLGVLALGSLGLDVWRKREAPEPA